ncbi:MAG TPA: ECF transporter S component [Candidatus Limnocylindrales bacterium]|nr:ECF transporter S component [Candidatus Limnocylindrales bacterium]
MTATSMTSSSRWSVDSRVIVYAAIGAALYAVLGLFSFVLPGTTDVQIRPAFALVIFFGYAFGPIVGLFTGFVGNAVIDQIQGAGLLTYWNWSLANGVAGLVAGLSYLYAGGMMTGSVGRRALGGAIAAIVGSIIGFLLAFLDIALGGTDFNTVLTTEYIPVIISDLIAGIILVPVLVYAWEPLKASLGR